MSQGVHVIARKLPGYGLIDGKSYAYSGVSGRVVSVSRLGRDRRVHLVANVRRYRASFVVCRSGGHRRNPDFSRHNRKGISRNRNMQNEEKDSFGHLDDSEMLASKNGPILSLSNTPKSQATAAPGPKEKEIVELFRKVHAQLREKAAAKEEKKVEASQGKGKESETVDSLLKLLRKHSIKQGKRKVGTDGNGDFAREQPEKSRQSNDGQSKILFNRRRKEESVVPEPNARALSRPPSNFRRRSPVPQVKFQSLYANEETMNSAYGSGEHLDQFETQIKSSQKTDLDLEIEADGDADLELESDLEPEATFSEADMIDELSDGDNMTEDSEKQQETKTEDLSLLKLPELRALAKSRGVKGYSKMKKANLVELLTGDSI